MNNRKLDLGTKNIIGAKVTQARNEIGMLQKDLLAKLQVEGIEMSLPALSLLEGQKRPVFDYEIYALAKVLGKSPAWFLGDSAAYEKRLQIIAENPPKQPTPYKLHVRGRKKT